MIKEEDIRYAKESPNPREVGLYFLVEEGVKFPQLKIKQQILENQRIVERLKARKEQLDHGEEYTYEPYRTLWLELQSILKGGKE